MIVLDASVSIKWYVKSEPLVAMPNGVPGDIDVDLSPFLSLERFWIDVTRSLRVPAV